MLKVAIIGLGTISTLHRNAIMKSDQGELVAICDIDKSTKENYTDAVYANVKFYDNIDDMLANETLDCVHICLPHYLHVPVIKQCANAGINVFTEKPLGLNYAQCEEIFETEKKYGVKIAVCFQNRYNNTTVAMKKFVEEQTLGKLLGSKGLVTWRRGLGYYQKAPWRSSMEFAGGGAMINQSIHTIDLLSYICGEFESVHAKTANFSLPDFDIEDSVIARFKYKNQDAHAFFTTTITYCTDRPVEIELVFEKASLKLSDSKLYKYENETVEFITEDQSLTGFKDYYGASHMDAIEAFYTAIINDTDDYVSVQEAAYSLKSIDNINLSSKENKSIQF